MTNNKKVAVLLTTYDGEAFLPKIINCLLAQQGVMVKIFAYDDNSADDSVNVLSSYSEITIKSNPNNLGAFQNFRKSVIDFENAQDFDFFAFADQDDEWNNNKLAKLTNLLGDSILPAMSYSNESINGKCNMKMHTETPSKVIFFNPVPGHLQVFNRPMFDLLQAILIDRDLKHDLVVTQISTFLGSNIRTQENLVDFNLHKDNVIGKPGLLQDIPRRVKSVIENYESAKIVYKELVERKYPVVVSEAINDCLTGKSIRLIFSRQKFHDNLVKDFLARIVFLLKHFSNFK